MTYVALSSALNQFLSKNTSSVIVGVEREALRSDHNDYLASTGHPLQLGDKLTHPFITTDYAEALLEFITLPYSGTQRALQSLELIQSFSQQKIGINERQWPSSMPCILPDDSQIPVADYGSSPAGKMKSLYREGLGHRYGKSMQMIAGLHYNFSFKQEFLQLLWIESGKQNDFRIFCDNFYFNLLRNFRRYNWLLIYLFGATPVCDASFMQGKKHRLSSFAERTLGLEYATSLRMGPFGYTSEAQQDIIVNYNNLDEYIRSIEEARLRPYADYEKIGIYVDGVWKQLNSNLLQIDNEFYSSIRPKHPAHSGQSALQALYEGGVEYIEVRLMDIDYTHPLGLSSVSSDFLSTFLIYCASIEAKPISCEECQNIKNNLAKVVNEGRRPNLELIDFEKGKISLKEWASRILSDMEKMIEEVSFERKKIILSSLEAQKLKVNDPDLTPSGLLMQDILTGKDFIQVMHKYAKQHQEYFLNRNLEESYLNQMQQKTEQSLQETLNLENETKNVDFAQYLKQYFERIKIKF